MLNFERSENVRLNCTPCNSPFQIFKYATELAQSCAVEEPQMGCYIPFESL